MKRFLASALYNVAAIVPGIAIALTLGYLYARFRPVEPGLARVLVFHRGAPEAHFDYVAEDGAGGYRIVCPREADLLDENRHLEEELLRGELAAAPNESAETP